MMSCDPLPAVTAQVPEGSGARFAQTTSGVGVFLQSCSHPSPSAVLPSSQASPASIFPFPQPGSLTQAGEQPSPPALFPSSHSSPGSICPLPQFGPPSFLQAAEQPSPSAVLP